MPNTSAPATSKEPVRIALMGNPNVGKSTLFNILTGSSAKIGNYPGITIERKTGFWRHRDFFGIVVDLPGIYSLATPDQEKKVALNEVANYDNGTLKKAVNAPDVVLCLLDSTNLKRSLLLYMELRALGYSVLPVATMADSAAKLDIEWANLEKAIGQEIVKIDARKSGNRQKIAGALADLKETPPKSTDSTIQKFAGLKSAEEKTDFIDSIFALDYEYKPSLTNRLDSLFLRPWLGLSAFVAVLAVLFQAVFSWAEPVMGIVDAGKEGLQDVAGGLGEGWFTSLLTDGIIEGVGGAVIFLPQIAFLFLFISVLEDTGIMARAAFVLHRILSRFGLSGKSVVPLLSSNACAIPGVMAARTIANPAERMAVIFAAPFMTCSARLPVYALLIAAFIPATEVLGIFNAQGLTLVFMYGLGTVTAVLVAWLFRRRLDPVRDDSFLLELPPYRMPSVRTVVTETALRCWDFLKTAGTIIFLLSIVIWFLSSYPEPDATAAGETNGQVEITDSMQLESSYMGKLGKSFEWAVEPLGFDWKIGVTILTSFVAREVAVSSLAILYNCKDCDTDEAADKGYVSLTSRLKADKKADGTPVWTLLTGLTLMVFYAYAAQCMSTLAVVKRETDSWIMPVAMFGFMTTVAYVASLLVYQVGSAIGIS